MRYLNKIVFINSGSVKYADINLDGNVHFIGTQGVGKSTLLRAILFFYNADKTKLGIAREKKRYDEFYFAWQNSYIVYEVNKGDEKFCVLTYKQNGRVAYRFINSSYNRGCFIDEEGKAFESWDRIKRILVDKDISFTKSVSSYDEFRKIIYGDNRALKPEYRKYAILETKQYQNIPRTIQNVLLNTKLEAPFIKETIIKSINEEDIKIDLSRYSKTHLRDFETELNDVKIWTRTNKKGEVIVKKQAELVVDHYRSLSYLKEDKKNIAKDLALKINFEKLRLPKLESEHAKSREQLSKLLTSLDRIKERYNKKLVDIKSSIKELKTKIKEANKKSINYDQKEINSIIRRTEQKALLTQQQDNLVKEREILTSQFSEVKQKYEILISQFLNQISTLENQSQSNLNKINQNYSEQKEKINLNFQELKETLIENNRKNSDSLKEKLELISNEIQGLQIKKEFIKHEDFYNSEIKSLNFEIIELEKELNKNSNSKLELSSQVDILKKDWEFTEKSLLSQFEFKHKNLEREKEIKTQELKSLEQKLEQLNDSLYGWLNQNYPNWEESLGKVIDIDSVLFNKDLNPSRIEGIENHFFGIKLDLEKLPKRIKSIDEYNSEKEAIKAEIENLSKEIQSLYIEKESEVKKQSKSFNKKLSSLEEQVSKLSYYINQSEIKLKRLKVELSETNEKAEQEKNTQIVGIETLLINKTSIKADLEVEFNSILEVVNKKIVQKESEKEKELSKINQEKEEKLLDNKSQFGSKISDLNQKIEQIKSKANLDMGEKISDSSNLEKIEKELAQIQSELAFIEENSILVIEYKKDKRELFDQLPKFKTDLLKLEQELASLEEKEQFDSQKQQEKIDKQKSLVGNLFFQEKQINKDLNAFKNLAKSEIITDVLELIETCNEKKDLTETAVVLIEKLKGSHFQDIEKFRDLEKAITKFVSNFGEENIFKFQTKFTEEKEFLDFSSLLQEFLEEDKINYYEQRINDRFSRIILQIGREINELTSKEAEIEKIISKINNDFKSKNFVGAINSVEMRTQKSSNKIVRLLLDIKQFNKEHGLSIGENNMFSAVDNSARNQKAVELLKLLISELDQYKKEELTLSESFDLEFRIVENENDSGWVEKLTNVGSEGTDILVKAMLNILLLNVFKENASKKFEDFKLHCMMDEVGKLHPSNVRGILKFANDRNIMLINGSPTSTNAMDYRYTYNLSSMADPSGQARRFTKVTKLVKAN